jgi:transcriptional regulator with XRE-family HTH domain
MPWRNPVDVAVGEKVRLMRLAVGFDQSYTADQIGVALAEFQECECGQRRFGAELLQKLGQLLGVPPSHFFRELPDDPNSLH